jgi:hypothetical protein
VPEAEIPHRRIAALLGAAALLVGGSALLAAAVQDERFYEPRPTSRGSPPSVSWNVSPIEPPDELAIYRLGEASQSAHDSVRIAKALGMDPDEVEYDLSQRTYWIEEEDPRATLHVSDRGREITYHRETPSSTFAEDPPELPTDEQALEQARAFLEQTELMPPEEEVASQPRVFVDERAASCQSTEDPNASEGSCTSVNLTKTVRFERLIDGYPVVYGDALNVGLGDEGHIREFTVRWEPIDQIDTEATITYEKAYLRAQAMEEAWWVAPGSCERAEVTTASVGYFLPDRDTVGEPWGPEGPWVFPVYLFEGSCEGVDGSRPDSGITIAVPATR